MCVCVCMRAHSGVSNSLRPHALQPDRLIWHEIFQAVILESVAISYSTSPVLAGTFFTPAPPGKPWDL